MSGTITDAVRSAFTPEISSKIAVLLGETEGHIQNAVHGAVAMVLTDIVHKSYLAEPNARVWDLSKQASGGDFFGELHELSTTPGGLVPGSVLLNKGTDYARSLLLTRIDAVIAEISRYAGISIPSASFITGIVSFASLDAIGRHVNMYNMDAGAMGQWLKTQVEGIRGAAPAGLQVKQALALTHYPWETPARRRSRGTALVLVLILVIIVCAAFYYYQQHRYNVVPGSTDTTAPAPLRDTVPAR